MADEILKTKCAPAERLPKSEVDRQHQGLSEDFHSGVFDFFPMPLIIVNAKRQIVFSNKAFRGALDVQSVDEYVGHRPGEVMNCVYANAEAGGCGTSEFCRECGALIAMVESLDTSMESTQECQLLLKRDEKILAKDFRVHVSPWVVNEETYYVVSIVDIEDEKRRRVLEKIFFHDILNAAGGAKGLMDLLLEEIPESSREIANLAQASLFKLIEEIKRQKQLLAVERKEYTLTKITLQGLELVRSVALEYQAHVAALDKEIVVDDSSVNVEIVTDYTLLMRVLVNMVLNALEATPIGGRVVLGLRKEGGEAVFWVNNAQVMDESTRLQVFKRSFSTKGEDRGLGTYSMKLLTENYLGGSVDFCSVEGQGTTFLVRIPKK